MDKKKKKVDPPLPKSPSTNGLHRTSPTSSSSITDTSDQCPEPLFTCDICTQEGLTEAEMRTHVLLQHVEGGITCPFCDLAETTLEQMNVHVNSVHLDYLSLNGGSRTEVGKVEDGVASKYSSLDSSASAKTALSYAVSDEAGTSSSAEQSSLASTVQPIPWTTLSDDEMDDSDSSTLPSAPGPVKITNIESEEQSRKRAKLYLDVPASCPSVVTKTKFVPGNPNLNAFTCPFCPWMTSCPKEIGQHVNAKHMDILSPAKGKDASSSDASDLCNNNKTEASNISSKQSVRSRSSSSASSSPDQYSCPICSWATTDAQRLERHVHTQHVDILSPGGTRARRGGGGGGGGGVTPMSVGGGSSSSAGTGSGSPLQMCPMCGMEFSDTDSLTQHADGHFSSEHTPGIIYLDFKINCTNYSKMSTTVFHIM